MKTIKILVLFYAVLFTSCVQSQIINNLTDVEYNSIKINNINWKIISDTSGDNTQIETLFGNDLSMNIGTEPSSFIEYWNDEKGFYLYFEENNPNINDFILHDFIISNNQSNLTIKGVTVTVGDNISSLGNVNINSSGKDISFGSSNTEDILMIKFNPIDNKITIIEYSSFN